MTEFGLAPLPPPTALAVRWVNRSLKVLNRWFMVPAHRHGLGPWIGTPIGGYILLLRVRGRKSGLIRETPLSYLIEDGSAWVLAGFGTRTEWYRNLLVRPGVEIWLPGRVVQCRAEEVTDPAIRDPLLPRLIRAAGVPGLLIGCNPWTAPNSRIVGMLRGIPLIRLTPLGEPLLAGPDDPGGRAWLWRQGVVAFGILAITRLLAGLRRPRPRADQPEG
jgi:deazaflavin-dependent oxidoreductase (nitroreductase family)